MKHPIPAFNFTVLLADLVQTGPGSGSDAGNVARSAVSVSSTSATITLSFSEVTGVASEMEVEEYREGGNNGGPLKFAKWGRFPNLVCRRGVTETTDLWDWYSQVLFGPGPVLRRNGFVLAHGVRTTQPAPPQAIAGWFFFSAIPERLAGPSFNAATNAVAIETLELVHEGMVRLTVDQITGLSTFLSSLGGA